MDGKEIDCPNRLKSGNFINESLIKKITLNLFF